MLRALLCRRVYAARIAHVLALTEYAVLKQQRDGLLVPSRSWLHLHPAPLLRLFDVNSYPLVKLLSLLSEPLVAVLSVYGELEPARPVLVGFELENDIVRPKRMIIPYRMQLARISVRLHRKQRFGAPCPTRHPCSNFPISTAPLHRDTTHRHASRLL